LECADSSALSPELKAVTSHRTPKQKPLHLIKKDGTVAITVSPFDGANRIRFLGSPALSMANFRLSNDPLMTRARYYAHQSAIGYQKSAMCQTLSLNLLDLGSPETYLIFKSAKGF